MQDAAAVEVLEAGDDLSEVISDFWFCQRVPRFPDVGQGLRGTGTGQWMRQNNKKN